MRISSDQQYQRLQDNIAAAQARMARLEGQLSSGKRLQRPSDDLLDIDRRFLRHRWSREVEECLNRVFQPRDFIV